MPGKQKFIINKVNNNQQQTDLPIKFSTQNKLNLELIEDKTKIKTELINQSFKPNIIQKNKVLEQPLKPLHDQNKINEQNLIMNNRLVNFDKFNEYNRSDYSDSEYSDTDYSPKRSRVSKKSSSSSEYSSRSNYSRSSHSSSGISDRLIEMLKEDNTNDKLPDLNDLNDLNNLNDIEKESKFESDEDKKRELLFKFELLKKSYKGKDIPDYNIHTDYNTLNRGYEITLKRLTIDNNVDNYKTYLIGGFMLVEFIFGKYLKFDMQGFTSEQIKNISSYDKLLVELGEKSYVPEDQQWPVEVRLLCLILFNAALFIASKMILKNTGDNLFNMINTMTKNATKSEPKRKMKSPQFI